MKSLGPRNLPEGAALRELFSHRAYLLAYFPLALCVGLGYLFLLEWISLGTVAIWALHFLPLPLLVLSVGFGGLFPLLILLDVFLWRNPRCVIPGKGRHVEGTTVTAVILGVVPNLLCCTPIVPTVLALFITGGTLLSISAPIQHTMAVYETEFYAASLVLLWVAIHLAALRMNLGGDGQEVVVAS